MKGHRYGFSLMEILVALGVIAIALLGLLSAYTYGMRANQSAQRRTEALSHARAALGEIRSRGTTWVWGTPPFGLFNSSESERTALAAAPLDTGQVPAGTGMERNITVLVPLEASGHKSRVARVQVRVLWEERGVWKNVALVAYVPRIDSP